MMWWYLVIIGGLLFLCWALYLATKDEEEALKEFLSTYVWPPLDEDDEEDPDAGHFSGR